MYLTAMRVRSSRGEVGINAVLYEHRHAQGQNIDWQAPDLERIANLAPGRRLAQRVVVPPGGNSVEAFLDIAARDGTQPEAIEHALTQLRHDMEPPRKRLIVEQIAVEFSVQLSEQPLWERRFEELRSAALDLLRPSVSTPLTIYVEHGDQEKRFRLREEDRLRIAAGESPGYAGSTLSVRDDVASEFARVHGELFPHVAEWLTGLSKDDLFARGGVRFIADGKTIWEWPDR